MMTSSNGNIIHVAGLLWGEFTGHRWIPLTKASDTELWCFLWSAPLNRRLSKQSWGWWFEMPLHSLWRHCNGHIITWFDRIQYHRLHRNEMCNWSHCELIKYTPYLTITGVILGIDYAYFGYNQWFYTTTVHSRSWLSVRIMDFLIKMANIWYF